MYDDIKITPEDIQLLVRLKSSYLTIGSQESFDSLTRALSVVSYHYGKQIAKEMIEKEQAAKTLKKPLWQTIWRLG